MENRNKGIEARRGAAQPSENQMKVLGIQLTPPSTIGLLRMLGFTLAVIAMVEIADSLTKTVWASEGSLSFVIGGFSGFLVHECGVCFRKHGWRAFALLIACAIFVYSALSLVI
jgi:hypothetical protein